MARRLKLADRTPADLADAEVVSAVDPTVPAYYKQVWTLTPAADLVADGAAVTPRPTPNALEVELDSGDPDQLQTLRGMVEAAKADFLEGLWDLNG